MISAASGNMNFGWRNDVDMWQYSDSGRVRGIRGEVDMNYSFKDYEKRNPTDRHRLCPETRREEE